MARPELKTVEYFPFYVKDGDTLFLLENKYGCEGLGFFTAVMRFLSQVPDHHYCIKDEVKKMRFFATAKIDEDKGIEMLNIMSITGKINKVLWDRNRVIVSEDFLASVADAYKKRVNDIITIEEIFALYPLPEEETKLPDTETKLITKKQHSNTQSKVKESKGKESKGIYGEFENVLLSEDEYKKCIDNHNLATTNKAIEKLSSFKASSGKKYKSDYAAMNTWAWKSLEEHTKKSDVNVDNSLKFGGLGD